MSAQVYSVPGQNEGRRKAFLEWGGGNVNSFMGGGGNVNYYKSVHHPIPTWGNREHPGNFQSKSVSSPFNWVSRYILFWPKLKGKGRPFSRCARWRTTLWDYPKVYLVVIRDEKSPTFVKFEIILPLLRGLLDHLTNKHCRVWSSMINLWIDFRTYQKQRILLSAGQGPSNNLQPSKTKNFFFGGEYDAVTVNMLYLKAPHDMVSQNS